MGERAEDYPQSQSCQDRFRELRYSRNSPARDTRQIGPERPQIDRSQRRPKMHPKSLPAAALHSWAAFGRGPAYARKTSRVFLNLCVVKQGFPPSGRASETGLELDAYRLIVNAGLPEPELQVRVIDGNGDRRRVDIAYLPERVDVEADSERWHDPIEDARRDEAMRAIGWEVLRYRDDVIYGNPERMLREIADTLRARSHGRSLSA